MTNEIVVQWIRENAEALALALPVELCPDHEDGGEFSWGQNGHPWKSGHHQILAVCIPWMKTNDEMIRCVEESENESFGLCVRPLGHLGLHIDAYQRSWLSKRT